MFFVRLTFESIQPPSFSLTKKGSILLKIFENRLLFFFKQNRLYYILVG
ncbi:hypothetical protein LEP1GSC079_5223 [Leptospira interrogans str. FPW1039]|uniref:Uncharacterized protein n=1 Tax=Leptospira interrogans str. FPW1039 TaxID=1193040 RepID=A0A0F6IBJ0_LEPIR|nr:hypothetical protein LEP1GSC079_5223 [Leptospira interrogans str. FPW1039]